MKHISSAVVQVRTDFWGAILGVFIPVIIFGFLSSTIAIPLAEPIGGYFAFILFTVFAICLIAFLVAEGSDNDFGTLRGLPGTFMLLPLLWARSWWLPTSRWISPQNKCPAKKASCRLFL